MRMWCWTFVLIIVGGCAGAQHLASPPATQGHLPLRGNPEPLQKADAISEFQGEYRFLSNFYPATVVFEGITYPTAEHAYQSAKTLDMNERRRIAKCATPAEAKTQGRKLELRPDWETAKFDVMLRVVRDKFSRNPELRAKLLATDERYLEEGNTWGDVVWGVYQGKGDNRLGRILMQVREELR